MRSKYKKAKWLDTRLSRPAKKRALLEAVQMKALAALARAQAQAIIYTSGRREGKVAALIALASATHRAISKVRGPQCRRQ